MARDRFVAFDPIRTIDCRLSPSQWRGDADIKTAGMAMLLQVVVSLGFILVVNAPQSMVGYGAETFEARYPGLVLTVMALALLMVFGVTYWHWLGYDWDRRRGS